VLNYVDRITVDMFRQLKREAIGSHKKQFGDVWRKGQKSSWKKKE
jgi:hypothetical protein